MTTSTIRFTWRFVLLAGMSAAAFAQTPPATSMGGAAYYSCRTASGRLVTSDRPIMECMDREQRAHNADGSVRNVIAAPLTPEQKAAREEEARQKAEAAKRADEQKRRDVILLSSYSSVEGLERARERALGDTKSLIEKSRQRLAELEKERKALDAERGFYTKEKLPATVQRKIDDNAFAIKYETDAQARRQEDIAKINQRYDADKARLVELLNQPVRK
ncbi:MAG TPA: hypothetical protein VFS42_11340 [Burkholderiaceae bacterium]|nr:hypothetical protein [Burkholderiaceae bacterium]